jgi:hypothetical protein
VSGISKFSIGIGAGEVLLGAVALGLGLGNWGTSIGYIFLGIFFILTGITPSLGGRNKKVIRGLCFGFGGVAIGFMVVGLVLLRRS